VALPLLEAAPLEFRGISTTKGKAMRLFSSSIGRKAVMAVTGLLMVLWVVGHLLGNLTIFWGPSGIDAYAVHLHELWPVVWTARIVMGLAVILHIILAIQLTLENWAAKPQKYAVSKSLRATFAGKYMIWTGLILAAFVGYHLLQFTFRVTPGLTLRTDALQRFDVYAMVVGALSNPLVGIIYLVAMASLFLHLFHGVQSGFQTLGLSNAILLPRYGVAGKVLSAFFLVGFGSIPAVILAGILR
jgi:succinate dehydrogenase / fumarate reductase cytochrome b subunit